MGQCVYDEMAGSIVTGIVLDNITSRTGSIRFGSAQSRQLQWKMKLDAMLVNVVGISGGRCRTDSITSSDRQYCP